MRICRLRQRRFFLNLLIVTAGLLSFFSSSCASRSLDGRGASIGSESRGEIPQHVVALISTNAEPYDAFDIAREAIEEGKANFLIFPEWGFLNDTEPITEDQRNTWNRLAVESGTTIILGVRERGRNTILVFQPNGSIRRALRRDGQNSPKPTSDTELAPTVIVTRDGLRIGILICDESRLPSFFEQMVKEDIDALFVPNNVGSPVFEADLLTVYRRLGANFDRFVGDRFRQDGKRNQTHVYRARSQTFELNTFGETISIGKEQKLKKLASGISYSISYHALFL